MNAQIESHIDVAKVEEYVSLINILNMIFGAIYNFDGNNTFYRHSTDIIRNTTHSVKSRKLTTWCTLKNYIM